MEDRPMMVVGVDTGADGAICFVDFDAKSWSFIDLGKDGDHIILPGVVDRLRELSELWNVLPEQVAVERLWAMPGQSSKTTWAQAIVYGQVLLELRETFGSYTGYTAMQWKKPLGLVAPKGYTTAQKKRITLEAAREWWPWIAEDIRLAKHNGRADALMVAAHHHTMLNGGYNA